MKKIILSFTLLFSILIVKADEGMWLLSLIHKNYEKMQEMGLALTVEEIYSTEKPSMKDAVVIFGGGCTGEIISNKGLLLTNHHCGYGNIQALSTPNDNILANGFWAKTYNDELLCEGLSVSFFIRMEDVTDIILAELNDEMTEQQRRDSINKRSNELEKEYSENNKYRVRIASMFNGNEYYMFIYQTYNDVRLVGTPPASIGKFGGDTDNWMWTRHTGDFALFRVYTDKDGNPATYSENNIPLVPKWYFPISILGIKENDFAMILGYPGSTDRFLTSYGVKMAITEKNPTIVNARNAKLEVWNQFRKADPIIDLQYASKYARISNYWKYYIGQTQQLINNDVVAKKEKIEDDFRVWARRFHRIEYEKVLSDIENAYKEISKYEHFTNLYHQAIFGGPEIFSQAAQYRALYELLQKKEQKTITEAEKKQLETRLSSLKTRLETFFKDYNVVVDKAATANIFEFFYNDTKQEQRPKMFNDAVKKSKNDFKKLTEALFGKTIFADKKKLEKFLQKPSTKILDKDLTYEWYGKFLALYQETIAPVTPHRENLNKANRLFVRGLLEMKPEKLYAPNANSQIRLTYGKVGGYPIRDGLIADYYTTLAGVMAKEDPNNREFMVPEKLKQLYQAKDYGRYAEEGRLHVNFLTDNDITGGNSGSPVINGKGQLIGCAFDGNWEAMSGDIFFEPKLQKCINVDIRYILFIVEKFGGAKHLIDEMNIVKD